MSALSATSPTLAGTLLGDNGRLSTVRMVMLAIAGSLLLWVSAKISVPFWPVLSLPTVSIGMSWSRILIRSEGCFWVCSS